jgi:putative transcriptional regulator
MLRDWLVELRERAELTHEIVAKKAEIKRQYYSMIENGNRNPSVEVAKRIADTLNFDWTLFFEQKGNELLLDENKPSSA